MKPRKPKAPRSTEAELTAKHAGMVDSILTKRFARHRHIHDDLRGAGLEALVKAIRTYNRRKGRIKPYLARAIYRAVAKQARALSNPAKTGGEWLEPALPISEAIDLPVSDFEVEGESLEMELIDLAISKLTPADQEMVMKGRLTPKLIERVKAIIFGQTN